MSFWIRGPVILCEVFDKFSYLHGMKGQSEEFLESPDTQGIKVCCIGRKRLFLLYFCVILKRKLIGRSAFKKIRPLLQSGS